MNAKQVAALLVVIGIVLMFQFGLSLRGKATAAAKQADDASKELEAVETQLNAERDYYNGQLRDVKGLVEFADLWRPYFAVIEEQNEAETGISMKVRASEMLNLSQRYEQLPHTMNNKPNEYLPLLVRATLLFDDNYGKLVNWMGMMERIRPTMRVGRVAMAAGARGNDIRMELMLEVPLRDKNKSKK
ncbi:MAG: hypothetical protein FGM15_06600 [Chthoniobacterales bacterium]|nr:hypothetical protein [Chthoniobacterales bacterium]